jgi:hypothetical protein
MHSTAARQDKAVRDAVVSQALENVFRDCCHVTEPPLPEPLGPMRETEAKNDSSEPEFHGWG